MLVFCGKTHHSLFIFVVQVGLEQEASQVIQDIQGQRVTQASQDLGFLETPVQKVKYFLIFFLKKKPKTSKAKPQKRTTFFSPH